MQSTGSLQSVVEKTMVEVPEETGDSPDAAVEFTSHDSLERCQFLFVSIKAVNIIHGRDGVVLFSLFPEGSRMYQFLVPTMSLYLTCLDYSHLRSHSSGTAEIWNPTFTLYLHA